MSLQKKFDAGRFSIREVLIPGSAKPGQGIPQFPVGPRFRAYCRVSG